MFSRKGLIGYMVAFTIGAAAMGAYMSHQITTLSRAYDSAISSLEGSVEKLKSTNGMLIKEVRESHRNNNECVADLLHGAKVNNKAAVSVHTLIKNREDTVKALFPELLTNPKFKAKFPSLEIVLNQNTTSAQKDNACELFRFTEEKNDSGGRCTFLDNHWVIATYHQLKSDHKDTFSRAQSYLVKDSNGKIYRDVRVATISPRYDLALLYVANNTGHQPLCVGEPSSKDLTYVRVGKPVGKIPVATESNDITLYVNGIPNYKFTKIGKTPLTKGDSGTPIYNSNGCLAGVIVNETISNGEDHFSPKVQWFIKRLTTLK